MAEKSSEEHADKQRVHHGVVDLIEKQESEGPPTASLVAPVGAVQALASNGFGGLFGRTESLKKIVSVEIPELLAMRALD